MIIVTVAGNLGREPEVKTTQGGDSFCKFALAGSVGFGDRKQTIWFDVTRWGKGADGLAGILRKGSNVTVSGELSTREHDGKTYLQIRADHVAVQGDKSAGRSDDRPTGGGGGSPAYRDDLDDDFDDVPFVTANPAREGRCG